MASKENLPFKVGDGIDELSLPLNDDQISKGLGQVTNERQRPTVKGPIAPQLGLCLVFRPLLVLSVEKSALKGPRNVLERVVKLIAHVVQYAQDPQPRVRLLFIRQTVDVLMARSAAAECQKGRK